VWQQRAGSPREKRGSDLRRERRRTCGGEQKKELYVGTEGRILSSGGDLPCRVFREAAGKEQQEGRERGGGNRGDWRKRGDRLKSWDGTMGRVHDLWNRAPKNGQGPRGRESIGSWKQLRRGEGGFTKQKRFFCRKKTNNSSAPRGKREG